MYARYDAMIDEALNGNKKCAGFTMTTAQLLCTNAQELFKSESIILELSPPINICSDVHGQFTDLLKILRQGELPPASKWLFLGDYVDRGPQSVEIMCLLLALKLRYPNHIFLLRGNHETEEISSMFGFLDECQRKMSKAIWSLFIEVFDLLPIAAIVGNKYFCIHGGISSQLTDASQLTLIKRPLKIPKSGMLTDLLWSDPDPSVSHFGESERGNMCVYGASAVRKFLSMNNLKMIVRGHQVINSGYDFPFPEKTVVTLYSAPNHSKGIEGAFMKISRNNTYSFSLLPHETRRYATSLLSSLSTQRTINEITEQHDDYQSSNFSSNSSTYLSSNISLNASSNSQYNSSRLSSKTNQSLNPPLNTNNRVPTGNISKSYSIGSSLKLGIKPSSSQASLALASSSVRNGLDSSLSAKARATPRRNYKRSRSGNFKLTSMDRGIYGGGLSSLLLQTLDD
ncbi:serine/threonine protein phosphatase [Tritrichomonas foetus]|uniref:Serine/threonine-protein phosphatase n=1 Tax=Tritrichomonas foetus TaxID=1144522 RepID=A0A1J4K9I9_9EUKA|nr:serine/threonine protein phosphatase [Tritrichomonas foetus]|eukprot:OHT07610.1 serine/threonine protein phosphatase [Tritrichomonas foetus]